MLSISKAIRFYSHKLVILQREMKTQFSNSKEQVILFIAFGNGQLLTKDMLKRKICSESDSLIEICGKLDKSNT